MAELPDSWSIGRLEDLLREPLRNGHSANAITNQNGIRTLTLTAVTTRDFSIKNTKITCADPKRVKSMWLKAGDILVERANTPEYVGLAALYEGPDDFAIFPDLMIRVRIDEAKAAVKFVDYWLLPSSNSSHASELPSSLGSAFFRTIVSTTQASRALTRTARAM